MPARGTAGLCARVVVLARAHEARADNDWLLAGEVPAAIPVADPQSSLFGPGGMPAIAIYRALGGWGLLGVRVRGGVLADGDAPDATGFMDPGAGGLGTLSLAFRVRPIPSSAPYRGTGLWIEGAGGGAVTGDLFRATAEAGIGWGFRVGRVNLGPAVRYLFVHGTDGGLDDRAAHLALVGVEISLLDREPAPVLAEPEIEVAEPEPPPPPPEPVDSDGDGLVDPDDDCPERPEDADGWEDADGCPDPDNDGDRILDGDDDCPDEAEVVNGIDDGDGCPDEGLIKLIEDRIILEERVLFDTERARVKSRAKPVLEAFIELWRQHPEWDKVVIEGHADERGPADKNQWLSELRAKRVKEALVKLGFDGSKIETVGYGEARPRDEGKTDEAYQRNRRVEFVIIEKRKALVKPDGTEVAPAPEDAPTGPLSDDDVLAPEDDDEDGDEGGDE